MQQSGLTYRTVTGSAQSELKVLNSRFIGFIYPVDNKSRIDELLSSLRMEFHDASHCCYAYRIGKIEQNNVRYSDDREPSGTAGKPIFQVIETNGLTNVLVAVIRYFGGKKLGRGGLIRAYGDCARAATESAEVVVNDYVTRLRIRLDYHVFGAVQKVLGQFHAHPLNLVSDNVIVFDVNIRDGDLQAFRDTAMNASHNNVYMEVIEP